MIARIPILLYMALMLGGCSVPHTIMGQYYINQENYDAGIESLQAEVREYPDSSSAYFYLGRLQLLKKQNKAALASLERADQLDPGDKDIIFWKGVAYGLNDMPDKERQAYEAVLDMDPDNLRAMTYLGHNLLERQEYAQASTKYEEVLTVWPQSPSALYNTAFIEQKLGHTEKAKDAWVAYLDIYSEGPLTRYAADHLNSLGDFSYRNHVLGSRVVTLEKARFTPEGDIDEEYRPSLDLVSEILKNNPKLSINAVVYLDGNKALAESRARSIKRYIIDKNPEIAPERVAISWFDAKEKISAGDTIHKEWDSVIFFTQVDQST